MARKSKIAKANKLKKQFLQAVVDGRKPKFATKVFNCCKICGRTRGYLGRFDVCRICFREKANAGELPGVRKSSW
ncbi:type Z 30S ribosomal protein S14 [Candidatus Gracilibacteria bacterium]|nr:MAG: type Z 30S ribosomal protein S14 [Candidatus Gracilibacteria bacterium]PIE85742.1 MAG: type Z 30S ribosomal protein S14 [Candidatus Gracilibacteria bacterium]